MPWTDVSLVSARTEFLDHARLPGANIAQLARRFGISRETAHKWGRRRPLTVLDDHSRFAPALLPCADERTETVRTRTNRVAQEDGGVG